MENPFASPVTANTLGTLTDAPLTGRELRFAEIGEAFVRWEKLRVWYNVVLAVVALVAVLLIEPRLMLKVASLEYLVAAAIGANACFFAGHIVECYATWFFGRISWIRPVVFTCGTLGAMVLTFMTIAFVHFEKF